MELLILAAGVVIVLIFIGKYRQNKKSQSLIQDAFYVQKNLAHSGYALTNHGTLVAMSIIEKGHSRYEAFSWIAVLVSAQNIKKHRDTIKMIQISKRCLSLVKDIKFMYDEGVLAEKYSLLLVHCLVLMNILILSLITFFLLTHMQTRIS